MEGTHRTLIARNTESFSFIYQENIDRLESLGSFSFSTMNKDEVVEHCQGEKKPDVHRTIEFFDPECDSINCQLSNCQLLYLPGGYPEKHLEALVRNEACRQAIKAYAEQGGRVIAECGGMMYLCQSIVTDEDEYPMCGVLPYKITARKADRKLSLGYRRFHLDGKEYRGHEFHYTQFLGETPQSIVQVYNAKGLPVDTPVFKYKNVLASYTHLYQI